MISPINKLFRDHTQKRLLLLNTIIEPAFNFKEILKKELPYDFFISLCLNKIYSLNVSMENNLLQNDVHQSVASYRYLYELYVKSLHILSESDNNTRINEFYSNKDVKLQDRISEISSEQLPPDFLTKHKEHYSLMSRMAHPNIESLNMHHNKDDDQIFNFVLSNVKMSIWFEVQTLIGFSNHAKTTSIKNLDIQNLEKILVDLS